MNGYAAWRITYQDSERAAKAAFSAWQRNWLDLQEAKAEIQQLKKDALNQQNLDSECNND